MPQSNSTPIHSSSSSHLRNSPSRSLRIMQRQVNFHRGLDVENQQAEVNETPRRRLIDAELPITVDRPRRSAPWYKNPEVLLHLIPVFIFVCFFVLWWFSSLPAANTMNDDQMFEETNLIERAHNLNRTRVDFAILATAPPPKSSTPEISSINDMTIDDPLTGDHLLP